MADYLLRIRALLTKAEGTDNEHEAAAFLAKAHELMVRHSIDEAKVRADGRAATRTPAVRHVHIRPGSVGFQARADLFFSVARALDLASWWRPSSGRLTVAGFAEDTASAEALFTSLLLQLDTAAAAALRSDDRPWVWDHKAYEYRRLNGRTYRVSFMAGYVDRVTARLAAAARASRETVAADTPGSALALRDKKAQVDEWVKTNVTLGAARSRGAANIDASAYSAGARAGATAALGHRPVSSGARPLPAATRKAG